jgi:hypothetical protein
MRRSLWCMVCQPAYICSLPKQRGGDVGAPGACRHVQRGLAGAVRLLRSEDSERAKKERGGGSRGCMRERNLWLVSASTPRFPLSTLFSLHNRNHPPPPPPPSSPHLIHVGAGGPQQQAHRLRVPQGAPRVQRRVAAVVRAVLVGPRRQQALSVYSHRKGTGAGDGTERCQLGWITTGRTGPSHGPRRTERRGRGTTHAHTHTQKRMAPARRRRGACAPPSGGPCSRWT